MSTYGKTINTAQLSELLEHVFKANDKLQSEGLRSTPILIWGKHGLGKTQSVMDFAKKKNWKISYCAPAQFEEMGDLHGMPSVLDPDTSIQGDEITVYSPPAWIPKEEGPGLLILDDINRADDRMLRGVMQLLQNFELLSWKLPAKWQIVATANPDDGNYSVTSMDDAMLTRMLHVTLEFELKPWLKWALESGIDKRGIDFVSTYPECITGQRTTPRSLVQFFDQIKGIADLKENIELVEILASSALDDATVAAFLGFVNDDLTILLPPEQILNTEDWASVKKQIEIVAIGKNGEQRLDRIATLCMRIYFYLISANYVHQKIHDENLINFLLHESVPNDLKMSFYLDLSKEGSEVVKNMLKDKRLAKLLLGSM
jgi:MoxR-like ATPase